MDDGTETTSAYELSMSYSVISVVDFACRALPEACAVAASGVNSRNKHRRGSMRGVWGVFIFMGLLSGGIDS